MNARDRVLWEAEDADQVLSELGVALAAIGAHVGVGHVEASRKTLAQYLADTLDEEANAAAITDDHDGGPAYTPFPGRRAVLAAPTSCEETEPVAAPGRKAALGLSASEAGRKAALTRWARVRARAAAV
jgi:hypothetical protein